MAHRALKNINSYWNTKISSYLKTSGDQSSEVILNFVPFFNGSVNQTSVAAQDSLFPALVHPYFTTMPPLLPWFPWAAWTILCVMLPKVARISRDSSLSSVIIAKYLEIQSVVFLFYAGSGPRPRTKRVKFDCTVSAYSYNINQLYYYILLYIINY